MLNLGCERSFAQEPGGQGVWPEAQRAQQLFTRAGDDAPLAEKSCNCCHGVIGYIFCCFFSPQL